jgi:hypothetical protein
MERQGVSLYVQIRIARSEKKGKEYFMAISLKKTVVMILLALALLAGLLGWTVRMMTLPPMQFHTAAQSSHLMADGPNWYCPPPPRYC